MEQRQPNLEGLSLPLQKKITWKRKRHLSRCSNTDLTSAPWDDRGPHNLLDPEMGKPRPSPSLHEGFDQIRKRLMAHLRDAAEELNPTAPPQPTEPDGEDSPHVEADHPPTVPRRSRRIASTPRRDPSPSPPTTRSSRTRTLAEVAEKRKRTFSATLSKEEIDEDFFALTGRRAPGRPKRRPAAVRKHVNMLLPGLRLSEVTAASYEVAPPRSRCRKG